MGHALRNNFTSDCPVTRVNMLVILGGLIFQTSPIYATDNTRDIHWHSESPDFKLLTDELPDSWEDAIEDAADEWSDETNISISEDSSSGNEISQGSIPVAWQASCPPATTLACIGLTYGSISRHISEATIVFNEDKSMGTSGIWCFLGIGTDVETVALHEFGHFMGLTHADDSDAAMYETYNGCQRTPDEHDIDSMNEQYDNHP